jgi:hypothetical protein
MDLESELSNEGIDRTGRTDPKKKISSFSISYESLCTMFPQMWINEIKDKEGKIFED